MVKQKEQKKIGGFLWVVMIWLSYFIISYMVNAIELLSVVSFDAFGVTFLITSFIFLVFAIVVFVLMCLKKKIAIGMMITLLIADFISFLVLSGMLNDYSNIFLVFIFRVLMVTYFLRSTRVRETLVN